VIGVGPAFVLALILGAACAVAGVGLLRTAWLRRGGGWRIAAGWAVIGCGVIGWRGSGAGWDKAVALAALAPILAAFALLIWKADFTVKSRKTRSVKAACGAEPPLRAGPLWQGVARTLLAGPVAGATAVSLAAATALRAPWPEADRLVAAVFIAPVAWAAAGVWATTDARLLRVGLVFCVVAAGAIGLARL